MILLLLSGLLITLIPTWRVAAQEARVNPRRNVLLLISDDQGRDVIGCYGNPVIKTPNQDRLAEGGVRFINAFATVASCSPSRATILTGMYQHTNGQYGLAHETHNQHTFDAVESMPLLLARRGYRTALIGKDHVKPLGVYGFQKNMPGTQGNRDVADMARKARAIFAERDERPFFLVIGYADPHREGRGAENRLTGEWKGFANEPEYPGVEKITYNPVQVLVPPFLPDQPEVRQELAEYYEAVSRLDQGIGLVMKALEETGQLEHTLIIYLSDNGIPFVGAKTTLYDAGLHLPLIVRAPRQKKRGLVNNAMVSWIDIAPTVIEWAGFTVPRRVEGRSFLPILEEENSPGWDIVYGSHTMHEVTMYYPMRAVRTRQYKLIWNLAHPLEYPQADDLWHSPTWQGVLRRGDERMGGRKAAAYLHRPEYELYDIEHDPHEFTNLAGDSAYAKVLAELQGHVRKMMEETHDPWMITFRGKKAPEK